MLGNRSLTSDIPFYKLSPGGNTTLLLPVADVPAGKRAAVAAELMDPLHLGAEQVGFIDLAADTPSIAMMGGEFCGNACRCVAALLAMRAAGVGKVQPARGSLLSSGASAPVAWRARPLAGHSPIPALDAAVRVNLTGSTLTEIEPGITRVDMPGMVHILLDECRFPAPADLAAEAAAWRARLGLSNLPAVGCIRHPPLHAKEAGILPLVWVRDTGSSCPETACGSGSLALALAVHAALGTQDLPIRQPSGEYISVNLEPETGGALYGWIGGPVRLIAQGKVFSRALF